MKSINQYDFGVCKVGITYWSDTRHTNHASWRLIQAFKQYHDYVSRIWEAAILALLMGGMYEVEIVSGGMIYSYIPSRMKNGIDVQAILRVWFSNLKWCSVGVINGKDLWRTLLKWTQVATYKYQVPWRSVLTFKLLCGYNPNSLRGCNVGVTDRRDLWSTQVRWPHVAWYTWRLI
jgi:hypothetical protein